MPSSRLRPLPALLLIVSLAACREMAHEEYVRQLTEAHDTLTARQKRLESRFGLSHYEHWDYDQDAGILVFSDDDTAKVVADIQMVGDASRLDSTGSGPGPTQRWSHISGNPPRRRAGTAAVTGSRSSRRSIGPPTRSTAGR